ncbi:MAG TPA: nucleotidyltransferase family protein [Thermoanaerobaculia bacterium]|nr:nucleotidyltransferase family protein [Thermoanaerobaculia bacterium]
MRPTIVILAAGFSRRFGSPKQTFVYEGETLLARAVRIALSVCDDVVVVTRPEFVVDGARVVINENAEEGIASSIRLGVSACDDAVLLMLCDQPHVTASHLRAMIDVHAPLVATGYAGVVGVPALFGREYRDALLALRGDRGAQMLLDGAVVIPCEEAAVDIDTSSRA